MIIFETDRLYVRRFRRRDSDVFFQLNGDEQVVRYIRPPRSREESDRFLDEVLLSYEEFPLFGRWAVVDKAFNDVVGLFAIIPVEGKEQMQLGYSLLPVHWGKGFATELTRRGIAYVFTKTDIDPLYAYTEAPNTASQHVLLKAGFSISERYSDGDKEVVSFISRKNNFKHQ